MKLNREARREARKVFRSCMLDGRLDESRVRAVVKALAEEKPRFYIRILQRLKLLVELEVRKRTHVVESAQPLADEGASVLARLKQRFGVPLEARYRVNPALLGGVLFRVGNDVWDGSIRGRLRALNTTVS